MRWSRPKIIFTLVMLAAAAGAGRLGLGTSPLRVADYTPLEAIVLAVLAAAPLLGALFAVLSFGRGPTPFRRANLGLEDRGRMAARGVVQGVEVEASDLERRMSNGKRQYRLSLRARRKDSGAAGLPVAVLSTTKIAPLDVEAMVEAKVPPGFAPGVRVWVKPEGGYRDVPEAPAWLDARVATALRDPGGILDIRTGPDGVDLETPFDLDPIDTRERILFACELTGAAIDREALPRAPVKRTSRSWRSAVPVVSMALGIMGVVAYGFVSPSNLGTEADVFAKVEACPPAMEALGGSYRRRMLGWQPTSTVRKRRPRWESYVLLLGGAERAATIDVVQGQVLLEGSATGEVQLLEAMMEVDGRTIDVLHCGEPAPTTLSGVRTYEARVKSVTGAAPARVGDACRIEAKSTNKYFCRFVVECAGTKLYGATDELGYAVCGLLAARPRAALVASDRISVRSEPELEFDDRRGEASVIAPNYSVTIALPAGR
ncbi:MAG: hypothetical protein U0271_10790 [Polyangiaceae bacterium]